jgi:hypothetical protein
VTEVTPNLPHFGSFCKYCFMGTLLHPTPCGFCIARLRQGNTLPTNSLNVPAGQFMFWYPWHC